MTGAWARLPTGRVVRVETAPPLDPLPDDAPAVLTYAPPPASSVGALVAAVLSDLDRAAGDLFPAWLPGAEGVGDAGGADAAAVRALALSAASSSRHFGPFLADLAERSLRATSAPDVGTARGGVGGRSVAGLEDADTGHGGAGFRAALAERGGANAGGGGGGAGARRFAPEVRAAGLARVIAAGFRRDSAALLVLVPPGLSPTGEEVLVAASEWLAHHGGFGVWLAGAPLLAVDRVPTAAVRLPAAPPEGVPPYQAGGNGAVPDGAGAGAHSGSRSPRGRAVSPGGGVSDGSPLEVGGEAAASRLGYPAVIGFPHPASRAEKSLEAALAALPWAAGRAWNQLHRASPILPAVRVDLMWRAERCAVEIDGPEHRRPPVFEADRRRDVRLQLDGYAVLRFTNDQIMTEMDIVLRQLERFLHQRRSGTFEGSTPHA
ncbi:hypothetical protein GCM10009530_45290 [Microbispora corallina]|uniref:DUF559 domain-containing protein n=1 Tax=Microbispora corallina TaxID=83302 RepID=A0ABQ4FWQ4_9ACTN|nr:DUF559 domain-containing protein [Microbispora corallina]GIH39212.1 hypothetical protein Mco01_22120 [Microbispora corallina]